MQIQEHGVRRMVTGRSDHEFLTFEDVATNFAPAGNGAGSLEVPQCHSGAVLA